jgi:alpha-mannosidase
VYTTQAKHKLAIRNSEEETLNAEKYASLAWALGDTGEDGKYPNYEFTDAWEKITFNDFHDLAAGSGIGVIYRDARKDFATVRRETSEISDVSLKTLAAQVNTSGAKGVPVLIWNPLAWVRSGPVTIDVQVPDAVTREKHTSLGIHNTAVRALIFSKDTISCSFVPCPGHRSRHRLEA